MVEAPIDTGQERYVLLVLQIPADLNYDLIGEIVECHFRPRSPATFLSNSKRSG